METVEILGKYIEGVESKENVLINNAIKDLKDPLKIKKFYDEYIEWIKKHGVGEWIRDNPKEVADLNIGFMLGFHEEETINLWFRTLDSVEHPTFGRDFPSRKNPDDIIKQGINLTQK